MKRTLLSILILSALTFATKAQLLWEISGNGIEKPSYLFGTHHLAPLSVLESTPGFNEALESVWTLYGEMDMSVAQSPESQMKLAMAGMAPADSTLSKVFSPSQLDSINTFLKGYLGDMISVEQFEPMRPAMLTTTLSYFINQKVIPDSDPSQQIDTEIQRLAAEAGKEIKGLETIEDQCQALFGGSIIDEAHALMDLISDENEVIKTASELSRAYLAGDLKKMLAIMTEESDGEWEERMLNKRNADWIEILAGILPSASVLIAVGAGHLPGDKGLINLLREKGFNVKAVTE